MKLRHIEKLLQYKDILDAYQNDFHLIALTIHKNQLNMDRKTLEDFIDTFFTNLKAFQYYLLPFFTPYLIKKYENQINFYSLSAVNVRIPNEFVIKHYKELNWEAMFVAGYNLYDKEFWKFCKNQNILPLFMKNKLTF